MARTRSTVPQLAGKKILLVEDEEDVQQFTREALISLGYSVTTASDGLEGLKKFEENSKSFDLIITDIVMPDMDGIHLAKKIRETNSEIFFLFISGYNEYFNEIKAFELKNSSFLQKPFSIKTLGHKVWSLLSESK